jgi:phage terminase large subunit
MQEIILPNNWKPRDYQWPAWDYFRDGGKRALLYWHRRSGKDDLCLHLAAVAAIKRVGNYWHMLPEQSQARKAIWEAVNPHTGKKRIDEAFPLAMRARTLGNEMMIEFVNGSTWQVVGSDNYDSLVGATPIGVVFSEWAIANPHAWTYISPILEENGGWAAFVTTTRGKNHAYKMYEAQRKNPEWFTEILSARDTNIFTQEQLAKIERELIGLHGDAVGRALYQQEYMSSFDAAIVGAVYGAEIAKAREEKRVRAVPYDRSQPVQTVWDIGYNDSTAIWFVQQVGGQVRFIDYHEDRLKDIAYYAGVLRSKGYSYGSTVLPHDAFARNASQFAVGKTIADLVAGFGFDVRQSPKLGNAKQAGLQAARMMFSRCVFDEIKCEAGVNALTNYRYVASPTTGELQREPLHDWSSHGADAFGYAALSVDQFTTSTPAEWSEPLIYKSMGIR